MKRKWIALVLSVSVLAGTAAVPAFASEIQQEISEMPAVETLQDHTLAETCLLYTSPSPRDTR